MSLAYELSDKTVTRFRNATLFLAGLGGIGYETIRVEHPEPSLLIVFAAMMGLPAFLSGGSSSAAAEKELAEAKAERDKALKLLDTQSELTQRLIEASENWSHL